MLFRSLFVQFIEAHAAGVEGIAEPVLVEDGQLHGYHRVACQETGGFGGVADAVIFGHMVRLGKLEVVRAVQFREEAGLVVTEVGVGLRLRLTRNFK